MPVDGIKCNVGFSSGIPFEERFFGIVKNLFPFLIPFEFVRFFFPESFEVLSGKIRQIVPVL